MKIAIISDVHANLEALNEVLKDIKKRKIKKIFCLGDTICKGPRPKECIKVIRENCEVVLRGNTDRYFSLETKFKSNSESELKRIEFHHNILSDEEKEYLYNLPLTYEFYMSGNLIRLFHATPNSDDETITNLDSPKKKLELFMPTSNTSTESADIVLYGHLHHQFLDKLYTKTLVNVGSVGNSFDAIRSDKYDTNVKEVTNAHYVILEGDYGSKINEEINFELISVPYDIEKELKIENIENEVYSCELTKGKYRDMQKIYDYYKKIGIELADD